MNTESQRVAIAEACSFIYVGSDGEFYWDCPIDGMKVFQTIAFGAGNGYGAAVSNIQLYEEKNGKVVPATCTDKRKSPNQ